MEFNSATPTNNFQQPQVPQDPDRPGTVDTQSQVSQRKRPILWILLLILAVGLVAIGYYFLVLRKQPEEQSPPASQPTVYSQEELSRLLTNLLAMDDFNLEEEMDGDFQGCRMVGSYVGRKKGDNQYALNVSQYADEEAIGFCGPVSVIPTYTETYWTGEDIYYRHYEDKDFEKLEAGSNIAVALKPRGRLEEFFPDLITFLSSEDKGQTVEVKATLEQQELSGNFTFVIDKTEGKILSFSYEVDFKEGGTVVGEMTITSPAEAITLPPNI